MDLCMIFLNFLICAVSLQHAGLCIPTKNITSFDPPEIITAPPQPTNFELVVGTRFGSSENAKPTLNKSSRMETMPDLSNMGRFGLRLPKWPRRPSFESGFRPKPLAGVLQDRNPVLMLPERNRNFPRRRKPSRIRRPYQEAHSAPVSVLSPFDKKEASSPWPNLGASGRPIGSNVLKHLIKNVGGKIESLESQDSSAVTNYVRPTRRTDKVSPITWATRIKPTRATRLKPTRRTSGVKTTKEPIKPNTMILSLKTAKTTTQTPPTGQVEPVSRPPWLDGVNIVSTSSEEDVRFPKAGTPDVRKDTNSERDANVGTADITPFNRNATEIGVKEPSNPSRRSPMSTENLAYILIGGCTALSITFLVIVAVTIHCRKVFRQKKLMKEMRRSAYLQPMSWAHHGPLSRSSPDHYLHGAKKSPKPRLVPWLTLRRPSFRKIRSRPPNGGALRFETVGIGNNKRVKRTTVALPNGVYMADGRRKVTGGDIESFSTSGEGTCQCTCSSHLSSDDFEECSDNCCAVHHHNRCFNANHCHRQQPSPTREQRKAVQQQRCCCRSSSPLPASCRMCHEVPSTSFADRHCQQHQHNGRQGAVPVTGSNYLSNPDGLIFWSSNNDRLI